MPPLSVPAENRHSIFDQESLSTFIFERGIEMSTTKARTLEERIDRLESELEIHALVHRYAELCDAAYNPDGLAAALAGGGWSTFFFAQCHVGPREDRVENGGAQPPLTPFVKGGPK